ncbi:hypothetical protein Tco_1359581 [Tanacetum coccineum]
MQQQQQQHGSTTALNKQIIDTLPKVTWPASESEVATECAIYLTDYEEADEVKCCPRVNMCIMSHVLTRGLTLTHPTLHAAGF